MGHIFFQIFTCSIKLFIHTLGTSYTRQCNVHVSICQRCKTSASQKPQIGHQIAVTLTQLQLCFLTITPCRILRPVRFLNGLQLPTVTQKLSPQNMKYDLCFGIIWSFFANQKCCFCKIMPNIVQEVSTYVHYVCSLCNLNEAASILMISV